jgi:hypothetical protein
MRVEKDGQERVLNREVPIANFLPTQPQMAARASPHQFMVDLKRDSEED